MTTPMHPSDTSALSVARADSYRAGYAGGSRVGGAKCSLIGEWSPRPVPGNGRCFDGRDAGPAGRCPPARRSACGEWTQRPGRCRCHRRSATHRPNRSRVRGVRRHLGAGRECRDGWRPPRTRSWSHSPPPPDRPASRGRARSFPAREARRRGRAGSTLAGGIDPSSPYRYWVLQRVLGRDQLRARSGA